jgi:ubiquinone/menaquinone biosynthesis C-methylase UbiE
MRPVDDRDFDVKSFVADGYDRCGDAYSAARGETPPSWLALLAGRLTAGATVLDIGCGSGVPVTRALAARFAVTGVDISSGQIDRARRNLPRATFVHGDIMKQAFPSASFAGVAMIYTLFHLPRPEQPVLLRRIHAWLQPGGLLLATLARTSEPGYIEDDFCGASMYWSHFDEQEYDPMLKAAGFQVLETRHIGHGYATAEHDPEIHPLVLAQKVEGAAAPTP